MGIDTHALLRTAWMGSAAAGRLDLTVPTRGVEVEVWTLDGSHVKAEMALHLQAADRPGPETVQDRLNDDNLFVPLSLGREDDLVLLNKVQIIRVDVNGGHVPESVGPAADVSAHRVHVQLINGEELEGTVRIDLPRERRRLSDYLNTPSAFLALEAPDRLHLLQKRWIARVRPR
jgi:hypothetical protein